MNLTIRRCKVEDLRLLHEIAYNTYDETFRHMNTDANMKAYLDKAFDMDKLRDEMLNSGSFFYFLYSGEKLAGYIKLNEVAAQTDINDPQSIEIERIYLKKDFQGSGLGTLLLNEAVKIAETRNKSYLWLGVWEKNDKAIAFYKKNGFYEYARHFFIMGDEKQADFLMRRDL